MDNNSKETNSPETIICNNCGKINNKSNNICIYCGTKLNINANSNMEPQTNKSNIDSNPQTNIQKNLENVKEEMFKDSNKTRIINCPQCGIANNYNNSFCVQCGTKFNHNEINNETNLPPNTNNTNNIQTNIQENQSNKIKRKTSSVAVLLGITSIILSGIIPYSSIIIIILAILSLFKEETKDYGKTVLIGYGILFVTSIIFMIILYGMCIAAFR